MARELILLALRAISGHRLRSVLSMLGIGIGITSVILLTSIGEGTKRYIMAQFTQFGTNILAINPGKAETTGLPGALGGSTRPLTLDAAQALERIAGVEEGMPMAFGMAKVEARDRARSVYVYGVTPQAPLIWQWDVRIGSFWPDGDPHQGANMVVLGTKLKRELFREENALGELVWIGGTRFRVTGIMEPKGQVLGMDLDDSAWIPVATAMRLFNLAELMEIDLVFSNAQIMGQVERGVKRILTERHGGKEDFSVTSQAAMLEVFGNIMDIITMSVGAIAGISLVVGAIGILTMMWIAVGERTNEIGLVRAIGASRRQVHWIFLSEAAALATLGGLFGVAAGLGICELLRTAIPGLPIHTPMVFLIAALAVSIATGLISGVMPARRAAALDPIQALRTE
jgi:putative ABC transport system permease protein